MSATPRHEGKQRISLIHLSSGVFVILWLSGGVAGATITILPSVLKVAILCSWVLLAIIRSTPFLSAMVANAWPLAVMLLISVLFTAEVAQSRQYTQGLGYLLIGFALLCFYSQTRYRRERYVLMWVMIADLTITGVRTLIALQSDPLLARYLATTEEKRLAVYGDQSFSGLGGYNFAYSLAAILLVLLYFLVKSPVFRLPIAVAFAIGLVVLFELAFTTAIVLVLTIGAVGLVWDLISRRELKFLIAAAVLLGWVTGLYTATLRGLAGQSWVTADVRERLSEFARFLSGDVSRGSDLGIRFAQWGLSIDTFWASGFTGLSGGGFGISDHGGHSQWFDLLASYGVYVLILGLFFLLAWRVVKRQATDIEVAPLRRAWMYFFLLGFVNPLLFSTIVLTLMFFLPALASWFSERSTVSKRTTLEGHTT